MKNIKNYQNFENFGQIFFFYKKINFFMKIFSCEKIDFCDFFLEIRTQR